MTTAQNTPQKQKQDKKRNNFITRALVCMAARFVEYMQWTYLNTSRQANAQSKKESQMIKSTISYVRF